VTQRDRSNPEHRLGNLVGRAPPERDPEDDRSPAPSVPRSRRARSGAWWLAFTGRLVMFAGAAAAAAFALARPAHPGHEVQAVADRYRCPMHPDVDSDTPASCPICGMALVLDVGVHGAAPTATAPVMRVARQAVSETVRAPAWLDAEGRVAALVYRDDLLGLAPEQPAILYPASSPSHGVDIVLTADPATDWDSSTARVQFRVVEPAEPRPAEPGVVVIPAISRELNVIPAGAVLHAPDGAYVLALDASHRRFVRRAIRVGRTRHGVTAVLSGIAEGDAVVATGAFLVDVDASGTSRPGGAP
jgi:hypothetical protein